MNSSLKRAIGKVDVTVLPTDQFKITTIGVQFLVPLEEERVTATALLPYVLMRGSDRFPNSESIQKELARLYGASLGFGVIKKGNVQIPSFTLKVVNEKFLGAGEDVFGQSVSLLSDILFHPHMPGGRFADEEVKKEVEQQKKRIESIFDDKIAFASERCQEELGKGYQFSLPRLGFVDQLQTMTAQALTDAYHELLAQFPVQIMVVGDVDAEQVFTAWEKGIPALTNRSQPSLPKLEKFVARNEIRHVEDQQDVNQGKLNIGYGTSITFDSDLYPSLTVYNSILGGSATSKLFTNVREKASLCYYVNSRADAFTGALFIQSGIEVENYEKAKSIIDQQLEDMRNGNISETELEFAKRSLINQYRTANDSPDTAIDLNITGLLTGRHRTLDTLIEDIDKVTLEDVSKVAPSVVEDTVYFLRNKSSAAK